MAMKMPMQSGLEVFERAVEARGRILRVEADQTRPAPGVIVLTFDVGRIVVRPEEDGLRVEHLADKSRLPEASVVLDDEEPWWRLLGQPITAAWPGGVADGVGARGLGSLMVLKLRFREETENPRVVQLEATGPQVRVSLEADA
jgi:hypothetical protein